MALAALLSAHTLALIIVNGQPEAFPRTIENGWGAFDDIGAESTWYDTPSWIISVAYTAPYLSGGTQVTFICTTTDPCEVMVFQVKCPTCSRPNGGIPVTLAALGWQFTRCAPSFTVTKDGIRHPMVGFRKTLLPNERESFLLEGEAEYTAFAMQSLRWLCTDLVSAEECVERGFGGCVWVDDACEKNRCIPPPSDVPFVGPVFAECASECAVAPRPTEVEIARMQYPVTYASSLPGVPALAAMPPLREAPLNTWLYSFASRALPNPYFDRPAPTAELMEILTNPARSDLQKLKLIQASMGLFTAATAGRVVDGERALSLDDLRDIIPAAIAPQVTALHEIKSDPAFARYRLSGYVPFTLRKAQPQLMDEMDLPSYRGASGLALISRVNAALGTGRLYAVDFGNVNTSDAQDGMYLANPVALFEIPADSETRDREGLQVLCVQVYKGKVLSIATPDDNEFAWTYAKNLFNSIEANYHESVHHLGETHMMVGAIGISIRRSLPQAHPVHQLMNSFIEGTILINWIGDSTLVNRGGPVDKLFSTKLDAWNKAAADAMFARAAKNFTFPAIMQETGLGEAEFPTTYYPYREFASKLWEAQHEYARDYLEEYYTSDAAVNLDDDLTRFRDELALNGIGWVANDWTAGQGTVEFLVDFLAATMFFGSVQHATVGRPQGSIVSAANVCPLSWSAEIPEDISSIKTEADLLAAFSDLPRLFFQRDVMHVLAMPFGTFSQFDTEQFVDPPARLAARRFTTGLDDIEATMVDRNAHWVSLWDGVGHVPAEQHAHWAYTDLLPSHLTVSINI
ncbi:Linoleate 9/13-lipoxygenase [Diplonema papillatum]|nr:Linoleate 9/13-lipoxygenase [Diplonema papillatum]